MLIFVFGAYPITNFVYSDLYAINESNEVLEYWNNWYLIMLFIGFAFPVSIVLDLMPKDLKFERILINCALVLFIGNIIDRAIFDVNYFKLNDVLTIAIAIITSSYKYYNE